MSTNLPVFDKAEYVRPPEVQLAPGHELTGAAWTGQEQLSGGFPKAVLHGTIAAVIGSLLYAAFTIITHIEIGIVALFVGIMVGGAMMHATDGTGGRRYQIAAAVLTYFAVSLAAVPEILYQLHSRGTDISHISVRGFLFIAAYGVASPFLALKHFVSGAIGLFILYLGIQAAWKATAGKQRNG